MTLNDFIVLVGQMRAAQKQYFKNRNPQALRVAIEWEAKVDAALRILMEQNHVSFK